MNLNSPKSAARITRGKRRREALLAGAQAELRRHYVGTFALKSDLSGNGLLVTGCPACEKVLRSTKDFIEHLAVDVLPGIIERARVGPDERGVAYLASHPSIPLLRGDEVWLAGVECACCFGSEKEAGIVKESVPDATGTREVEGIWYVVKERTGES